MKQGALRPPATPAHGGSLRQPPGCCVAASARFQRSSAKAQPFVGLGGGVERSETLSGPRSAGCAGQTDGRATGAAEGATTLSSGVRGRSPRYQVRAKPVRASEASDGTGIRAS
jgi:hypothetical protein